MSNKIIKIMFLLYHGIFVSKYATCRYIPTCSQYSLEATEKFGMIKGSWLSLKRISSCHPFSKKPIYDPI